MLSPDESLQTLTSFFRRRRIVDLEALFTVLGTRSRMSVFRRLSAIGYLSSYSHAGRYYTLADIPQFDLEGLWQHEGVGFSRYGSLKSTVAQLVEEAKAGRTHHELSVRVLVRVHNTLLDLVRARRIGREPIGGQYVYVSADPARGSAQATLRRQQQEGIAKPTVPAPSSMVIEVLLELIQSARVRPDAERVAARLAARGLGVTVEQVEVVFGDYGLKKTARSRSRRSPH